jgi:hypothetical protein
MATNEEDRDAQPPGRDYEVGFGKPPKHTQFKPGESANPNGRRGKKNRKKATYGAMIREEFEKSQTVVGPDGRRTKMSTARLIIRQTMRDALKGSAGARKEAVKLMREFAGAAGGAFMTDAELAQQAREEEQKKALAARLVHLLEEKAAAKHDECARYGSAEWALELCRTTARAGAGEAEARQQLLAALDRELAAIRAKSANGGQATAGGGATDRRS